VDSVGFPVTPLPSSTEWGMSALHRHVHAIHASTEIHDILQRGLHRFRPFISLLRFEADIHKAICVFVHLALAH